MNFSLKFPIVSNNCLGGELYRYFNKNFDNPFIWNIIPKQDFDRLIKNWKDLDLLNFDIVPIETGNGNFYFDFILDGNINVYFVHHLFNYELNKSSQIKRVYGSDYLGGYETVLNLVEKNWIERTKRFMNLKLPPIFLYYERPPRDRDCWTMFNENGEPVKMYNCSTHDLKTLINIEEKSGELNIIIHKKDCDVFEINQSKRFTKLENRTNIITLSEKFEMSSQWIIDALHDLKTVPEFLKQICL